MPTPIDRVVKSNSLLLAFGGVILAVAAWSIFGGDMFPPTPDPAAGDAEPASASAGSPSAAR